jgi:UDP:flavonoid glycosyltransferase YjiC (YdhE family)
VSVPPDLPETTVFTGAWIDRSTPSALSPELDAFLAGGSPPVVITFGSMRGVPAETLQITVDRLVDAGWRVVVQGSAIGESGSTSVVSVDEVDHRALFPRAVLVVHHGGAGTTHAVVAAGIPSVVVPHVGDQRYWADRLPIGWGSPPSRSPSTGCRPSDWLGR